MKGMLCVGGDVSGYVSRYVSGYVPGGSNMRPYMNAKHAIFGNSQIHIYS